MSKFIEISETWHNINSFAYFNYARHKSGEFILKFFDINNLLVEEVMFLNKDKMMEFIFDNFEMTGGLL